MFFTPAWWDSINKVEIGRGLLTCCSRLLLGVGVDMLILTIQPWNHLLEDVHPAPINSRLNVVVLSLPRLGWVEMAVGFPKVPVTPGTPLAQTIFLSCCPLNDRRRVAHRFFKIGRLSCLFCLSLTRPRFLILLLLIAATFILTLIPSLPVQCALEMWPGGVGQCNATSAPNGSI